jgi:very-short-patch-repair endonuclease/ribosomal protein S18 acetylase RimI-like enzyme
MSSATYIIPFEPKLVAHFVRLNKAWIKQYFELEAADEKVLNDPQAFILDKGGHIFFAVYNGSIAGTFALQKLDATTFELSKMAVDETCRGKRVGHTLMEAAIEKAKAAGATLLVLYSNTLLRPAIHLYKKFGFVEVPLEHSHFKRANIKMQLALTPGPSPIGEGSSALGEMSSALHRQASPVLFEFAKEQRRIGTDVEELMWQQLRKRKLEGLKFRRQHPIGSYVADFYCHEKALVIELDGAVHQSPENKDYDKSRDQYLKEEGLQVLRFSNNDIYKNMLGVLQKIKDFANRTNENSNNQNF